MFEESGHCKQLRLWSEFFNQFIGLLIDLRPVRTLLVGESASTRERLKQFARRQCGSHLSGNWRICN